jgi:hypothetical protein
MNPRSALTNVKRPATGGCGSRCQVSPPSARAPHAHRHAGRHPAEQPAVISVGEVHLCCGVSASGRSLVWMDCPPGAPPSAVSSDQARQGASVTGEPARSASRAARSRSGRGAGQMASGAAVVGEEQRPIREDETAARSSAISIDPRASRTSVGPTAVADWETSAACVPSAARPRNRSRGRVEPMALPPLTAGPSGWRRPRAGGGWCRTRRSRR